MRKSRFSEEQIAYTLRQAEAGTPSEGALPQARHQRADVLRVLALDDDRSITGSHVAAALEQVAARRGYPRLVTVDNGSEFYSKAMDHWAWSHGVKLDFIRPGRPMENGYIESFN